MIGSAVEGAIYTIVLSGKPYPREWFVGARHPHHVGVVGICIFLEHNPEKRVGLPFSMSSCDVVEDEDVPDEIWAALAKWKLTHAD